MSITIAGRAVGPGLRCLIVAELGQNHNGEIATGLRLVDAALEAKADAVKVQIGASRVYVNESEWTKPRILQDGTVTDYITYRESLELSESEHKTIKAYAEAKGLIWFASPLEPTAVARMERLDAPCYKIASPMVTNGDLLDAVKATGKPIIISTGMSTLEQTDAALDRIGRENVAVMHCTSQYPCPPERTNLRCIYSLQSRYPGIPIGYSGHETGVPQSIAAVALGACIVERHLTLSRSMWGSDHAASAEPNMFRTMVGYIRTIESALGDGVKRIYQEEQINAAKFRKPS